MNSGAATCEKTSWRAPKDEVLKIGGDTEVSRTRQDKLSVSLDTEVSRTRQDKLSV